MTKYRILVADDEPKLHGQGYEHLLNTPNDEDGFDWELAGTKDQFINADFSQYDAVILDINLDKWDYMPLAKAVETIGSKVPIVFASGRWHENQTIRMIREVLASAKDAKFAQILILDDLYQDTANLHIRAVREQLRLAIARSNRYSELAVEDDEPIHILHLSDPQYGDPDTDGWTGLTEEQLSNFIFKICPNLHFIAITGDITYQGLPSEFEIAHERISKLLGWTLPVTATHERLLLVPGNHDVNLRLAAADFINYDFNSNRPVVQHNGPGTTEQRSFALEPFCRFAWKLTRDPRWLEAKDLCWVNDSFRHIGLRFIILNTVSELDCTNPERATLPVQTLRDLLSPPSENNQLFTITLAHHGPKSTSDEVSIDNWGDVGNFLNIAGVRVFLHGHGHERRVDRLKWNGTPAGPAAGQLTAQEFVRVMAPTSHLNSQRRPEGGARGFNLVTLNRSSRQVQSVTIQTFTLENQCPTRIGQPTEIFV